MSFQVKPWPFQSLEPRAAQDAPPLSSGDRIILRAFWVGAGPPLQDTKLVAGGSRFTSLKKLLNPLATSVHTRCPNPDLLLLVDRWEIAAKGRRRELLQTVRELLHNQLSLTAQQQELLSFLQNALPEDLTMILCADLLDSRYNTRHVFLPRCKIEDDIDFNSFVQRFNQALLFERASAVNGKSVQREERTDVKYLPLPKPPMQLRHSELTPSIAIYLSPRENTERTQKVADMNMDPLSVAVTRLQDEKIPVHPDSSPFWLNRLDPSALQRYVRELSDGLCGSVQAAFEAGPYTRHLT